MYTEKDESVTDPHTSWPIRMYYLFFKSVSVSASVDPWMSRVHTLVWQNHKRRGRALAAISGKVPRVSDLCFY